MLEIKSFCTKTFKENTYVVSDETKECMLVDCGGETEEENQGIIDYISAQGLTVKHIVCTHCHLDHTLGIAQLSEKYGIQAEANPSEQPLVEMTHYQALALNLNDEDVKEFTPIYTLAEDYTFNVGNSEFKVIHTPGHSPGGICLYAEKDKVLLSGDTLMKHQVGATNLPGGRKKALARSIEKLFTTLPEDVTVYPGHGETTTIGEEKTYNKLETSGSVRNDQE